MLLIVSAACLNCRLLGDALETWSVRAPVPSSQLVESIAYLEGEFVAGAGVDGVISSVDGTKWTSHLVRSDDLAALAIKSVAFGKGRFVAVGNDGVVVTSTDKVRWVQRWSGVDQPLNSLVYGDGVFVAVGGQNANRLVMSSEDGEKWDVRVRNGQGAVLQVIHGDHQFFAIATPGVLMVSRDGKVWTERVPLNVIPLVSLASDGKLVITAGLSNQVVNVSATSGQSNSLAQTATIPRTGAPVMGFGSGRFVMAAGDQMYSSTNGVDWTARAVPGMSAARCMVYGGGRFTALGAPGFFATSGDGLSWNIKLPQAAFAQVIGGSTNLMGLANAQVFRMESNGTWVPAKINETHSIFEMGYANERWFLSAVRKGTGGAELLTSVDGSSWESTSGAIPAAGQVRYGNGVYAGSREDALTTSPDGRNWTAVPLPLFEPISGIAYGNGRLVAVGGGYKFYVSTNGFRWDSVYTGGSDLRRVTFGNGKFAAIAKGFFSETEANSPFGNKIMISADGEKWTAVPTPFGPVTDVNLTSIGYANGWFVIVGEYGVILTSRDGASWLTRNSPTGVTLRSVTSSEGFFWVVGESGVTITSGNALAGFLRSGQIATGRFTISVEGPPGDVFRIEAASDLGREDWENLVTITNWVGVVEFSDARARGSGRFYRAVKR